MRKLKLNVEALQVESFAVGARAEVRTGTVHGRELAPGTWWWSCEGPTEGTCIGPTYCCPPTWKPTCDDTCLNTCPWVACGPM